MRVPSLRGAERRSNLSVIPGWSEGPDLRCAIAHRGILGFRVRYFASPRNDGYLLRADPVARNDRSLRAERLRQVRDQVFLVFNADRQPHHIRGRARSDLGGIVELAMCG